MLAIKSRVIRDLEVLVLLALLRLEVVAELERVISEGSGPLRLDLSELRSADSAGFAALRALGPVAPPLSY